MILGLYGVESSLQRRSWSIGSSYSGTRAICSVVERIHEIRSHTSDAKAAPSALEYTTPWLEAAANAFADGIQSRLDAILNPSELSHKELTDNLLELSAETRVVDLLLANVSRTIQVGLVSPRWSTGSTEKVQQLQTERNLLVNRNKFCGQHIREWLQSESSVLAIEETKRY